MLNHLIGQIENQIPSLEKFPLPQRVTFKYYTGRFFLGKGNFEKADEDLDYAYKNCPSKSSTFRHKQLILLNLIPLRMLCFCMPSSSLLTRYDMKWFEDIRRAVISGLYHFLFYCVGFFFSGNLGLLVRGIAKHQDFFVRSGIYLHLLQLEIITIRQTLKKMFDLKLPAILFFFLLEIKSRKRLN
jgi:hypothetical protein